MNDAELAKLVDIVLVEDSQADAEMTLRVLRRNHLTNRTLWLKDGVEAVEYLLQPATEGGPMRVFPKLVLLDIKMPRLDGIEVLRRMKTDPVAKLIPVVMLTSSAEDKDLRACYELGVNSYVVKPVEFGAFASVVAQAGLYWAALNQRVEQ
jgi:CheY-like chemotaxis protein